jgi:hypothetical protein
MVFNLSFGFTQTNIIDNLLTADSLWTKEVFEFPIRFAPEIVYSGFEEAYFPNGWSNQDSPDYWSYVFAWSLKNKRVINEATLEHDLQLYFDGLMNIVNKDQNVEVPESVALFLMTDENTFKGKIRLYNAFHTKAMMTLNVLVNAYYCIEQDRTLVLFRFSPSNFEDDIWEVLRRIEFNTNACKINNNEN